MASCFDKDEEQMKYIKCYYAKKRMRKYRRKLARKFALEYMKLALKYLKLSMKG